jgi:hypothetical protein
MHRSVSFQNKICCILARNQIQRFGSPPAPNFPSPAGRLHVKSQARLPRPVTSRARAVAVTVAIQAEPVPRTREDCVGRPAGLCVPTPAVRSRGRDGAFPIDVSGRTCARADAMLVHRGPFPFLQSCAPSTRPIHLSSWDPYVRRSRACVHSTAHLQ